MSKEKVSNDTTSRTFTSTPIEHFLKFTFLSAFTRHISDQVTVIGTKKSVWEAVKLFTQAAEKGHPEAQCHLGMMYRDGVGVKASLKVAKSWSDPQNPLH